MTESEFEKIVLVAEKLSAIGQFDAAWELMQPIIAKQPELWKTAAFTRLANGPFGQYVKERGE